MTEQHADAIPLPSRRRRGGGRVPILTREQILEAAERFEIADLSMPALAAQLGVTHSAIYYYFSSRGELLTALATQAARRFEPPPRTDRLWDEWLVDTGLALRSLFLELPHVGVVVSFGSVVHGAPFVEAIVGVMLDAGFTPEQAVDAVQLLSACSYGGAVATRMYQAEATTDEALMDEIQVAAGSPLRSVSRVLAEYDPEAGFRRTMATVVDGLRLRLKP